VIDTLNFRLRHRIDLLNNDVDKKNKPAYAGLF